MLSRFAFVAALAIPAAAQTQLFYDVREFTPPGAGIIAETLAVDPEGDVAGDTGSNPPGDLRGWVMELGGARTLPPLAGASFSSPTRLYSNGRAIGVSGLGQNSYRAVVWSDTGAPLELRGIPGAQITAAMDSNGRHEIVGFSSVQPGVTDRPVLWRNGVRQSLPLPPGLVYGRAHGIANDGTVGGYAWNAGFSVERGFLLHPDGSITVTPILPGGSVSVLLHLNQVGMACGTANVGSVLRAVLWDGTSLQDQGALPGLDQNLLLSINREGRAVGLAQSASEVRAIVTDLGQIWDLQHLIDPLSGWQILAAFDINNAGQIACVGISPTSAVTGCRLDPGAPPSIVGESGVTASTPARSTPGGWGVAVGLPPAARAALRLRAGPILDWRP